MGKSYYEAVFLHWDMPGGRYTQSYSQGAPGGDAACLQALLW